MNRKDIIIEDAELVEPGKVSGSAGLSQVDKRLIELIELHNGQFHLPVQFVELIRAAVPHVDLDEVTGNCVSWIASLEKGLRGSPGTALMSFIKKAAKTSGSQNKAGKQPCAEERELENVRSIYSACSKLGSHTDDMVKTFGYATFEEYQAVHNLRSESDTQQVRSHLVIYTPTLPPETEVEVATRAKKAEQVEKRQLENLIQIRHYEKSNNIARYDSTFGSCELFRYVKRGGFMPKREHIKFELGDFRYSIAAPLMGDAEQSMLLAIMLMARKQDAQEKMTPGKEDRKLVPLNDIDGKLIVENEAAEKMVARVKTGTTILAKAIGLKKSSQNAEKVEDILQTLAMVNIKRKNMKTGAWDITQLISQTKSTGHESLVVGINFRLTEILLASGESGGGNYAAINMDNHIALPKGAARLLHTWLCTWGGRRKDISQPLIETLIKQVYGYVATERTALYRQKQEIHNALKLISAFEAFRDRKLPLGYKNGVVVGTSK